MIRLRRHGLAQRISEEQFILSIESIHLKVESINQPLKRTTQCHLSKNRRHGQKHNSIHKYPSVSLPLNSARIPIDGGETKIPDHTHSNPSFSHPPGHLIISKPQTTLQCENFVSGYSCLAIRDKPNTNHR